MSDVCGSKGDDLGDSSGSYTSKMMSHGFSRNWGFLFRRS